MRRFAVLALALALAAGFLAWLWSARESALAGSFGLGKKDRPSSGAAATSGDPHARSSRRDAAVAAAAWHFQEGTPVRTIRSALQAAADGGDPRAQCRLGAELARCDAVFEQALRLDEQVGSAAMLPPTSAAFIAKSHEIAMARAGVDAALRACEGIEPGEASNGWRYVHRAARAGDLPSMLAFAITPPLSETNFSAQLDGWRAYRSDAVPLLLEAASRGSPRAIHQLAWVYGNLPVPGGSPLVAKDLGRALAYAAVARDLGDARSRAQLQRQIVRWRREASAEDLRRAASLETDIRAQLQPAQERGVDFIDGLTPQPEECDSPRR